MATTGHSTGPRPENTKMYNPKNSKGLRTWEWIPESIGGNETRRGNSGATSSEKKRKSNKLIMLLRTEMS